MWGGTVCRSITSICSKHAQTPRPFLDLLYSTHQESNAVIMLLCLSRQQTEMWSASASHSLASALYVVAQLLQRSQEVSILCYWHPVVFNKIERCSSFLQKSGKQWLPCGLYSCLCRMIKVCTVFKSDGWTIVVSFILLITKANTFVGSLGS